ncbi:M48 family metallopeptidase [Natrinema sp. LN54]|uniref:M48 family metallopeptidase n=1 Tax=Natrinema sp. LN54 TaxID=3458705 RepID=UPI004035B736
MTTLRTYLGLWIRTLVAGVVLTGALLLLLAAEFLLVFVLTGLPYVVVLSGSFLLLGFPSIAFLVGLGCYVGLLVGWYHVTNSTPASRRRKIVGPIRQRAGSRVGILALFGSLALVVGSVWLAGQTTAGGAVLVVPVAVTLFVVGRHLVHTVGTELSGDVAALRTLDDSIPLSDDADRNPELEEIRRRVARLAQQVGIPAPTVEIAATRTPAAMTVGYRPAESTIVLSRGLLDDVLDRELEAVLAHELAHVANRDAAVMSALMVPASMAVEFCERYAGGSLLGSVVTVLQALSRWSIALVARYREYVADDGAVAITGDPAALASALETLDRSVERRPASDLRQHRTAAAFSIVPPPWEEHRFFDRTRRVITRTLFGTHPPTEKRIERLRARS